MSNFSDARRSRLEEEAECPQCHTKNLRGNHVIILDIHLCAYCNQCGHEWDFVPKEKR